LLKRKAGSSVPSGFWFLVAPVPVLIYLGNPAVSLIIGAAISLFLNRHGSAAAHLFGQRALQIAVVLIGLNLDASQLIETSVEYSALVSACVIMTLVIGFVIGSLIHDNRKTNLLVSSGTAICGGTAVASLSPTIGARPEQTGVVLTLVFCLNAIALFIFPFIGGWLEMSQEQFGVWCAVAIHDTSSVIATAARFGDDSAQIATILKLFRTLWLFPLLILAGLVENRQHSRPGVPWFVVLFLFAATLGTELSIPQSLITSSSWLSQTLLVIALYLIGSEITRTNVLNFRGSVVLHGTLLWALTATSSLLIIMETV
jgi:uncharacterized integral membrane protein (TIGR00698 family)